MGKTHGSVLVTGLPGSGKTHLARYFRERGANAYDADEVKGLGRWIDARGRPVEYVDSKVNAAWMSRNSFIWSPKALRGLLKANKELYLFGTSSNMYDLSSLFERTYYLQARGSLIRRRLQSKSRSNPFGKSKGQMELILGWREYSELRAQEQGLIFVDASLKPSQIFRVITGR